MMFAAIGNARLGTAPPSTLIAMFSASEKGQSSAALMPQLSLSSGWRMQGRVAVRNWPTDYYGLGTDTRKSDKETYTAKGTDIGWGVQKRFGRHLWIGPRAVWRKSRLQKVPPGGLLESTEPTGLDGGVIVGAGFSAAFDTRDDLFAPDRGMYLGARVMRHEGAFGSDFDFHDIEMDARQYAPLSRGWVLALHQHVTLTRGGVPFTSLAVLGNAAPPARLRGVVSGRFRDHDAASAQGELRFPLKGRWTGVVFGGAGGLAERVKRITPSRLKWAGGGGLRYRVSRSERIRLRLDVARSTDETGVYFNLMEAF